MGVCVAYQANRTTLVKFVDLLIALVGLHRVISAIHTCPIMVGDLVRVQKAIPYPRFGWGPHVSHASIGAVTRLSEGTGQRGQVDFPRAKGWFCLLSEMEHAVDASMGCACVYIFMGVKQTGASTQAGASTNTGAPAARRRVTDLQSWIPRSEVVTQQLQASNGPGSRVHDHNLVISSKSWARMNLFLASEGIEQLSLQHLRTSKQISRAHSTHLTEAYVLRRTTLLNDKIYAIVTSPGPCALYFVSLKAFTSICNDILKARGSGSNMHKAFVDVEAWLTSLDANERSRVQHREVYHRLADKDPEDTDVYSGSWGWLLSS